MLLHQSASLLLPHLPVCFFYCSVFALNSFLGICTNFLLGVVPEIDSNHACTCSSLHHLLTWHSKSLRFGSSFHLLVLSLHKCRFVAGGREGWQPGWGRMTFLTANVGAILAHPLLNLAGAWAADVHLRISPESSGFSSALSTACYKEFAIATSLPNWEKLPSCSKA